jgi:hypothetical protein
MTLYLIKHHIMKTCGEVEVQLHAFLTLALDGGDWLASSFGRSTPGKLLGIWRCVAPRVGLDTVDKREIPRFFWDQTPILWVPSLCLCHNTYWDIPALKSQNRYFIVSWFRKNTKHAVAYLVEALCYKSEGHGFDSRWGNRIFQLT